MKSFELDQKMMRLMLKDDEIWKLASFIIPSHGKSVEILPKTMLKTA